MQLSLPIRFPLFILASVCRPLQCLISILTQGGSGGHFFLGSLIQSCYGEGGTRQTNITGICGKCSQCLGHTGFALSSRHMSFPSLHCSGSSLLFWELYEVGPGLRALPRSELLRFRFSGTPQRCRLVWACILCPSEVQEVQVTRCLASTVATSRWLRLTAFPIPAS